MRKYVPYLVGASLLCSGAAPPLIAQETPSTAPAATVTKPQDRAALSLLRQLDEGFSAIFEQVAPTVVVIRSENEKAEPTPFDFFLRGQGADPDDLPDPSRVSEGSGFIVRKDGYIVTNNHVVENASRIEVRTKDGRRFEAKVVGRDEKTDIAVLKIEADGLTPSVLGDSDKARVGQLVFAIGVPYNLDYSFSGGWISAKGRTSLLGSVDPKIVYEDYIQTDTFINPGNSGGPLFDVDGNVIGMNSYINGIGRGLAFAIPSNMLSQVAEQLIANGKVERPWIGINMLPDDEDNSGQLFRSTAPGVIVKTILPGTPAFKSDLRPGDTILAVNGKTVVKTVEMQREVLRNKIGDSLKLSILRDGSPIELTVKTEVLPSEPQRLALDALPSDSSPSPSDAEGSDSTAQAPDPFASDPADFGLRMQNLDEDLAEHFRVSDTKGALVSDVTANSPADIAGVKRGDLITEIDSNPVRDADQASHMLKERDPEKGILLFLNRNGQKTYAVIKEQK